MLTRHLRETCFAMVVPLAALAMGCGSDDSGAPMGAAGAGNPSSGAAGTTAAAGAAGSATNTGTGGSATGGAGGSAPDGGTAGTGGGGSTGTGGAGGGTDSGRDGSDCGPSGALVRPMVATAITAPSTATLVARFHAVGTQIYTCTASGADGGSDAAAAYTWTLKAPSAKLYDANANCKEVGTHFAGPTWKSSVDGSSVAGSRLAASPNAGSIDLLLLKAVTNSGEGVFANVTYIQRLDTNGGKAPADGCSAATVSMETAVEYSANYYFFIGGAEAGDAANGDAAGE